MSNHGIPTLKTLGLLTLYGLLVGTAHAHVLTLTVNQTTLLPGDTLRVGLSAGNPGPAVNADFYCGILLPDGVTVFFFTSLSPLHGVATRVDAHPQTFPPAAPNVLIPQGLHVALTDVFVLPFSGSEPAGTYVVFAFLTPPNALSDGRVEPGDLLALDSKAFTAPILRQPLGIAPNLVVLVHGCCTDAQSVRHDWDSLGSLIASLLQNPQEWEIVVWDWTTDAPWHDYTVCVTCVLEDALTAYGNASTQGADLATTIVQHSYQYIHLIAHSAGAKLIQQTARDLIRHSKIQQAKPFIHLTFLDAFTLHDTDTESYGALVGYPNHYAEHYVDRTPSIIAPWTNALLSHAYNVDITAWEHASEEGGIYNHQWPRLWYQKSVTSPGFAYGYPLSFEGGNDFFDNLATQFPAGGCIGLVDKNTEKVC